MPKPYFGVVPRTMTEASKLSSLARACALLLGFWVSGLLGNTFDPPAGYYAAAQGLRGAELKAALHRIIRNHRAYPYSSSSTDTWDVLRDADRDPNNTNNVLLLYNGVSVNGPQEFNNGAGWNREHVWPKDLGGPFTTAPGVGTDAHNLRACNEQVNSTRDNLEFDNGGSSVTIQGLIGTFADADSFEANNSFKGDLARIIFYMAVRYEGGGTEPNLEVDDFTNAKTNDVTINKLFTFGKLSTLLAWHLLDPVDDFERRRNSRIFFYQGNRNPFIDNPEFASAVFDPNYQPVISFVVSPALSDPVVGGPGGPFEPSQQTFTVANTSGVPITLAISVDVPWIKLSTASLSLANSAQASVEISIDADTAPNDFGSYSGYVSVVHAGSGFTSTYEVILAVTAEQVHSWDYELDEFDNAIITAYYGQGGPVQIPAEVDGIPVAQVGNGYSELFFYNNSWNGNAVTSVTIPSGVTTVADLAFFYSDGLTTVNLPDSVRDIGSNAFWGCWELTDINVDANNEVYASSGGVVFDKTGVALLLYPPGRLGGYQIPEGVMYVWDDAFSGCYGLTNVEIPISVAYIGYGAFSDCSSLTGLSIPSSVELIRPFAFLGCANLANMSVDPASEHYLSVDGVLFDKARSTLVAYPAGRVGAYTIPSGVTSIGIAAFVGCYGLTSVTIPDGVAVIDQYAFSSCDALRSITIPDSVSEILPGAFSYCEGLSDLLLKGNPPADASWIGDLSLYVRLHHLPGLGALQPSYGNRTTQVFAPVAAPSVFAGDSFQFSWSNTGAIPMNVWRATSLSGSWVLVSSNNTSGSFTDFTTPAGQAFYRASLP